MRRKSELNELDYDQYVRANYDRPRRSLIVPSLNLVLLMVLVGRLGAVAGDGGHPPAVTATAGTPQAAWVSEAAAPADDRIRRSR
jgi:hypothetical protein